MCTNVIHPLIMENNKMSCSDSVKKLRISLNISVIELSKILNVTRNAIYKWEYGLSNANRDHIKKIINLAKKNDIDLSAEDFL